MKVAILETIAPSGHEVAFDKGFYDELKKQGHKPCFFVPENYPFQDDYHNDVQYLKGGEVISYHHAGFFKKMTLSVTREMRRRKWFSSACTIAKDKGFDCIVIPTATPRYLKSILKCSMKNSSVPVIVNNQVFSFEKKGRLEQFLSLAKKLEPYKNIHIAFTSPNHYLKDLKNVFYINPPFYGPTLIESKGPYDGHEPITIGMYGYYRDDENTKELLNIFAKENFKTPVRVIMQTVTANEKDKLSCEEIVNANQNNPRFSFTDAYLKGETWQKAIDDVDIILAPYASMQFYYTYSAMCFNALGFKKPVMLANTVNPHVLEQFNVGLSLDFSDKEKLKESVVNFIDTYKEKYPLYEKEIEKASLVYSFENVVKGLLKPVTDR